MSQPQLLGRIVDTGADERRHAEIERRTGHRGDFARRDKRRIDRRKTIGANGQIVIVYRPYTGSMQIEKRMVREIDHRAFVSRSRMGHGQCAVVVELIGQFDIQRTGKSLFSVFGAVTEHDFPRIGIYDIPDDHVESLVTAVQRIGPVVGRERAECTVQREPRTGYTVGEAPDRGAEEALTDIMRISVEIVVTEHDVFEAARFVGSPELDDTSAEIGDGDFQSVPVFQVIEVGFFAADGRLERCPIDSRIECCHKRFVIFIEWLM